MKKNNLTVFSLKEILENAGIHGSKAQKGSVSSDHFMISYEMIGTLNETSSISIMYFDSPSYSECMMYEMSAVTFKMETSSFKFNDPIEDLLANIHDHVFREFIQRMISQYMSK